MGQAADRLDHPARRNRTPDSIVDRGSPVLANRVLAIVRKLFNWCCERGTLQTSPCDRVKAPAPEVKRDRVLPTPNCH